MRSKRFLLVLLIVILLLAAGVYYALSSRGSFIRGSDGTTVDGGELTKADVTKLVKAASRHIILPEAEEPVAARITDIEELLKTQPFYRGSINGDILLIYQGAAKAILYSPTRDILVNVGPIILDETQAGVSADAPVVPAQPVGTASTSTQEAE